MLSTDEQKTVLAMTDKLVRAATLAVRKERELFRQGMTYDEAHRQESKLRAELAELLKEVG